MREHKFSGDDSILIFDFLSHVVEKADLLCINDGQLITCLPHLLTDHASKDYRVIASPGRGRRLMRWLEALQYFLRTYGTNCPMQEAVKVLESLRQSSSEKEDAFASIVGVAAYVCG